MPEWDSPELLLLLRGQGRLQHLRGLQRHPLYVLRRGLRHHVLHCVRDTLLEKNIFRPSDNVGKLQQRQWRARSTAAPTWCPSWTKRWTTCVMGTQTSASTTRTWTRMGLRWQTYTFAVAVENCKHELMRCPKFLRLDFRCNSSVILNTSLLLYGFSLILIQTILWEYLHFFPRITQNIFSNIKSTDGKNDNF